MKESLHYTKLHRSLHWIIALSMIALFATGFMRMFWIERDFISSVLGTELPDLELTKTQLRAITKNIREPMWKWHEIFAKVMFVAFTARVIYMFRKGIKFPNPLNNTLPVKERFQGLTYVLFYVLVAVSITTGICIEYHLLDQWHDAIEETHKLGAYWFPAFAILHFGGLAISEISDKKRVIGKMIYGE